jgi:hypothetical protein
MIHASNTTQHLKERKTLKITCYYGDHSSMGYISLKPILENQFDEYEWSKNEITQHVHPDEITIPYVTDEIVSPFLDRMAVAAHTFEEDYEEGYDTEYGNDMDDEGYITGIELTLYDDRFIDLVKNQVFKVIRTEWKNKEFHLITFDYLDEVFKPENVIYKLTDEEDAFVIVQLVKPEDEGYFLVEKGVRCDAVNKDLWDSISLKKRETILNNIICERCSATLGSLECFIEMKSNNSLISSIYCNQCERRFVKVVEWE